jgi:ABC-type glycerol-3-phosphate transport system permease component
MGDLGDLKVNISADGKAAIKELDKVEASAESAKISFEGLQQAGLKMAVVGAAITASIGACVASFTSATSELKNMSNATGISTDSLQELKYAAESSGAGLADVSTAIKTLSRNLVAADEGGKAAQDMLTKLGISSSDIINLKPEEQFNRIANALNQIPNPAEKSAAAMQIFGKSGTNLVPMISELDDLKNRAHELGIVLDSELVNAGNNLGNKFSDVGKQLKTVTQLIGASIAPQLENLLNKITPIITKVIEWIKNNSQLVTTIVAVVGSIGTFLLTAGTAITVVATIVKSLSAFGLGLGALMGPLGLIVVAIGGIVAAIMNWQTVVYGLQQAWDFVVKSILVSVSTVLSAMSQLPVVGKSAKTQLESIAKEIEAIEQRVADRAKERKELQGAANSQSSSSSGSAGSSLVVGNSSTTGTIGTAPVPVVPVPDDSEYRKSVDARIQWEKAQFDVFSQEQKCATLELEKSTIAERLAAASIGSQEYYEILYQEYENEKALRELGNYELVSGLENAQLELMNHTTNFKDYMMGVYSELSSGIQTQLQALASGQIKTWTQLGSAIRQIWDSLKNAVIKAITQMIAEEMAAYAISKAIAAGKALWNAVIAGTDAAAKDPIPWTKIATGIAVFAGVSALIGKAAGAFAEGGIIGGNSFSGDQLYARVNSGEMILNSNQQSRLWDIVNGSSLGNVSSGNAVINQTINISTSGTSAIEDISQALRNGTQEALTLAGLTYEIGINQQGYAY